MQEQNQLLYELPIVPSGKYEGKCVTELLSDTKTIEWMKLQDWFSKSEKWKPIYNIVVHQTLTTQNQNSKTPEHNRLQNMFLDKNNQSKLLLNLFNNKKKKFVVDLEKLFKDEDFIRCFGIVIIPELICNLDKSSIKFEGKCNWDLVLNNCRTPSIKLVSNLENELIDKQKYKTQYDIEQKEKYEHELLLLDELITIRVSMDKEEINKYEKEMDVYKEKMNNYDRDMQFYLDNNKQNQIDVNNYEKELKMYEDKKEKLKIQKEKVYCNELGINYEKYVKWNSSNSDHTHTDEEKKVLKQIIINKVKPFLDEFDKPNKKPKYVGRIHIPYLPIEPFKPKQNNTVSTGDRGKSIIEQLKNVTNLSWYSLDSVFKLQEIKNKYQIEYKNKYEEIFNKHYENYRIEYYRNIIRKCFGEDEYIISVRLNENQYEININITELGYFNLFCELKPQLSDDYPCVLRKLQTQIELTKNDKTSRFHHYPKIYTLIIGSFTSSVTTKEELIAIFKQHKIKIMFIDEIFGSPKVDKNQCVNTEQILFDNKFVEENKILTDKLLHAEKIIKQLEEKNKQLEAEIISFKTQKQTKTIKDYYGKK